MQTKTKTTFDRPTKWNPRGSMMLLVPTVEPEKSEGGIFIPDTVRHKATSGFVAKVGEQVSTDFKIGDEVFFEQHSEYRIKLDDNDEDAVLIDSFKVLLHLSHETSHGSSGSGTIHLSGPSDAGQQIQAQTHHHAGAYTEQIVTDQVLPGAMVLKPMLQGVH